MTNETDRRKAKNRKAHDQADGIGADGRGILGGQPQRYHHHNGIDPIGFQNARDVALSINLPGIGEKYRKDDQDHGQSGLNDDGHQADSGGRQSNPQGALDGAGGQEDRHESNQDPRKFKCHLGGFPGTNAHD